MSILNPITLTATVAQGAQAVTIAGLDLTAVQPGMTIYFGSRGSKQGPGYLISTVTPSGTSGGTLTTQDAVATAYTNAPCQIDTESYSGDASVLTTSNTARLLSLMQTLLGRGTGVGPNDRQVVLDKTNAAAVSRLGFRVGGIDQFAVEQRTISGAEYLCLRYTPDGTTWYDALRVRKDTGALAMLLDLAVPSLSGGPLAGFRNRIINGAFRINQRAYVSGAGLPSGTFGHDRWKGGAGGAVYTFSQAAVDTTITITAGTLIQAIEGANIEGGTFTLSWSGTALGRVNGGAYAASPITVTGLAAGTGVTVEFGTGTLGKVQFEPGSTATLFERRPYGTELALCQRYYETGISGATLSGSSGANVQRLAVPYKVSKRINASFTSAVTGGSATILGLAVNTPDGVLLSLGGTDQQNLDFTWTASAEI